jgi:serine/threonine protein kinase/Tfp pilus assembly protein PilF
MEPEHWNRIKEAVHACLELKPEERQDGIRSACDGEPILMAEVQSLLDSYEHAGNFLESPSIDADSLVEAEPENLTGSRIGNYQISAMIAHGGMGTVYKAVRADDQFRKQVAIKLIRSGFDSSFIVRRFKAERQILANFDQPNIARLLDGGSTSDGRPYLVMEYVDGEPIDVYCVSRKLSTDDRLRLFRQVCAAVQFAHQNLVIHRDLKPSNILVTADGVPKLLDFGIAKILDPAQAGIEDSSATVTVAQMMTPEYASPEQFQGGPFTTATDVYSLGVVLYRLLTGCWPYRTSTHSQQEIAKAICEQEPEKPSTAIGRTGDLVGDQRGERVEKLRSRLEGDLDNILLKALRKEPERRYASVEQFSEDIRRYLAGLPVIARKDTLRYRTAKFVSRHKGGIAATAGVLALLVGAVIVSSWMAVRASRAEQQAQAVSDFLQNDLLAQASAYTQSGPGTKPDPSLKVRTALDRAAVRITGKFDRQPEVEAAIRDTMGQTYIDLGLYPEARAQFNRALELHRRVLGAEDPKTLKTMGGLGRAVYLEGKYAEAETLFSQALKVQRRVLGPEHPDTVSSMNGLVGVYYYQGKYAQAEVLYDQILQIRRRVLGPEHPATLGSMGNLANVYYVQGKYGQAEALYSQALQMRRRVLGPEHPATLSAMSDLGNTYYSEHKYPPAEALYSQALEIQRRVLGSEHSDTQHTLNGLASVYYAEGKYPQAEALYSQILETRRRVRGPEHRETVISMNNLAELYKVRGQYQQAETLFTQTVEISRRVLGPEHPLTLIFLGDFASMYQRAGRYGLAETYAAQALLGRRHTLGSQDADTMESADDLALAYLSQGKFAESEALAHEAFEFDRKKRPDHWQRFRAESLLGASLAGEKKYAEAEPLLLEGYQGMSERKDRIDVPDWYHLDQAGKWIVQLYQASGRPREAAQWRAKLTPPLAGSQPR